MVFSIVIFIAAPMIWLIDRSINADLMRDKWSSPYTRSERMWCTVQAWFFGIMVFVWPFLSGPVVVTFIVVPILDGLRRNGG